MRRALAAKPPAPPPSKRADETLGSSTRRLSRSRGSACSRRRPSAATPPRGSRRRPAPRSTGTSRELRHARAPGRALHDHERGAGSTGASPSASHPGRRHVRAFRKAVWRAPGLWPRTDALLSAEPLDLAGPEIALDVANEKRGIQIHLRLRPGALAGAGPELPDTNVDVLALSAPVTGNGLVHGDERAALAARPRRHLPHMDGSPRVGARRAPLRFFGRDGGLALYVGDATAPDGQRAHRCSSRRTESRSMNVTEITISLGDDRTIELGPDYPVPEQLNLDGSAFRVLFTSIKCSLDTSRFKTCPCLPDSWYRYSPIHSVCGWIRGSRW